MPIEPGTYALGPQDGTLTVRTARRGAIAKVGHDLLIEVDTWGATVQIGARPEEMVVELTADSNSLRVVDGTGGVKALGDDDRAGIAQTIREEVLNGTSITFRSIAVQDRGEGQLRVQGDLELAGGINQVAFDLRIGDDGQVAGAAIVKQTDWGMTPYTTLFGTLKVADEVAVAIDGRLSAV